MIGSLRGTVARVGTESALVEVAGVGYAVHCPVTTLAGMSPGAEVFLLVETFVREDMIRLFGFATDVELEWFRALQGVQGVGSKVALSILAALGPARIAAAVSERDAKAFSTASGVGPKLGQRIASELADLPPGRLPQGGGAATGADGAVAEAVSALVNLGYDRATASSAVGKVSQSLGPDAAPDALVRRALILAAASR